MKREFDYGDLESVAKKLMDIIYRDVTVEDWGGWNRASLVTEAVNSVAFQD